jgi:hypothetical protein
MSSKFFLLMIMHLSSNKRIIILIFETQRRLDNNPRARLETFIDVWIFQGYGVGSSSDLPPPFVVVSSLLYFKELCFWKWRIKNIAMHQFFHFCIRIHLTPCKIIYGLDYSIQVFVFCYF